MYKYIVLCFVCLFALDVRAQQISAEQLDAAARNAKGQSLMFQNFQDEEEDYTAYQKQMREQQAYQEKIRLEEEAVKKAQQERLDALKPVNLFGNTLKIYAIVNGEVITSRDMQDRANIFVATTQIPITKENREMVLERVLQSAIDEKIKLQEAKKNGVKISETELEEGIRNFANSNGVSVEEFKQMLQTAEVNENVFKSQMKAEMAWIRLVQRKATQTVRISQNDVKKMIEDITRNNQKQKFMISEIVISKKDGKHIESLVYNLRQDPRFELYAMQFSQSASAKDGGHLGWVSAEQLNKPLLTQLQKMSVGEVSDAISVGSDYYILKLEQKYTPGVDKLPAPTQEEVSLLLQNKKTEEIANKYLRDLRNKAIIERKA